MKIKSYSKLNIFLLVSKKRKKYKLHKIKSLIYLNKEIYDEIEIYKYNKLEINYYQNNKKINILDCNVKKILFFLQEKYKLDINYKIIIKKNIPLFSGIGGSSSNAAYIAKYILDLNNIEYEKDYSYFIDIGSDVPFFLSGFQCAYVYNFGDKIRMKKKVHINYSIEFNSNNYSSKDLYLEFDKNRKFNILRNYYIQIIFLKFNKYHLLINDIYKSKIKIF